MRGQGAWSFCHQSPEVTSQVTKNKTIAPSVLTLLSCHQLMHSFLHLWACLLIHLLTQLFFSLIVFPTSEWSSIYPLLSQTSTPRGTPEFKRSFCPSLWVMRTPDRFHHTQLPSYWDHYLFYGKTVIQNRLAVKHLKRVFSSRGWF